MTTRLDAAQEQFLKWLQLREVVGDNARVDGATLGVLIDCARTYIYKRDATDSAAFLIEEQEEGA